MTTWDLYIGFMDEEVAPTLSKLLEQGRTVLVVERGGFGTVPQRLFERLVGDYPMTVSVASTGTAAPTADDGTLWARRGTLLNKLAGEMSKREHPDDPSLPSDFVRKLNERSFFVPTAGNVVLEKAERPDRMAPPELSVFQFGADDSTDTPVLMVRAPEMGMQPTLVRPYLRLITRAVKALLADGDKVALHTFGASGSVAGSPGDLHQMAGSLFVGCEHDLLGDQHVVRGVVGLATATEIVDPPFHYVEYKVGDAMDLDGTITLAQQNALAWLEGNTETVAENLRAVREQTGREISFTLSYFGGEHDKHVAANLGLVSVNMEDYHVFRLARSMHLRRAGYPELADTIVQRVDVDPPVIPESVHEAFTGWARDRRLTPAEYRNLILWGLDGCRLSTRPEAARWTLADDPVFAEGGAGRACFGRYVVSEDTSAAPLDPFAVEIATDLLKTAKKGKAIPSGPVEDLGRLAAAALDADQAGRSAAVDAFVAEWSRVDEVSKNGVWVRPGKWKDATEPWLHAVQATAANVDRAFYRSTNVLALASTADKFAGPRA